MSPAAPAASLQRKSPESCGARSTGLVLSNTSSVARWHRAWLTRIQCQFGNFWIILRVTRPERRRASDGADGNPQAEQAHDAALEQRRPRAPAEGKTHNKEGDRVICGVGKEVERVRTQADGTRQDAGDDFDGEHRHVDGECGPKN